MAIGRVNLIKLMGGKCRIRMSGSMLRYVVIIRRKNAGWVESRQKMTMRVSLGSVKLD